MDIKFLKKKIFWLILLIAIGLAVFFIFLYLKPVIPEENPDGESVVNPESDKVPPSTALISPQSRSWHNSDFKALIYDSDLGSGLVDFLPGKKGCKYIIEDFGTGDTIGDFRACEKAEINVPLGEGRTCSSSYKKEDISQGKCRVSTIAFDRAGNDSGWKSRTFNSDLIKPGVGKISSFIVGPRETITLSVPVSDNSQIAGCWFYVNGKVSELTPRLDPLPCQDGSSCNISLDYSFEKEGDHSVGFGCQDLAGNVGFGEMAEAKIIVNHDPEISFCRVNPVQGDTETEFFFDVEASDPDGDQLSFLWDFGDNQISVDKTSIHKYQAKGTFQPEVKVFDGRGGEVFCQTAWVVAEKK
ncbi:MAG: PKD domain-containing protein [bacterium]|nr:PKD domain-containing protein [bacterium]